MPINDRLNDVRQLWSSTCSLENANTICRLFNIDRVFGKQHVKVTVTKCEIGYETQAAVSRLLVDNEVFAYGEGKSW